LDNVLKFVREWRVVTIAFLLFSCSLAYNITQWFMDVKDPNNSQGAFASAVVLALVGVGKYWMETKANKHDENI